MEEVLPGLFGLLVMGAFVAFFVWLIRFSMRAEAERQRIWATFAAQNGLTFSPPSGPWYNKRAATIHGTAEGVSCTLDTYVVSTGKSATSYTRLRAMALQPMPLDARVYRETVFGAIGDLLGAQDVTVGDEAFDKACVVKANREDLVRQWLHQPLRSAYMHFSFSFENRGGALVYRQGQIELVWLAAERDPRVLHAAVSVAVEAARFRGVQQGAFR
ncbi:MAG: hypothetical protein JNK05_36345 [Myxococcales bacterium]|nr:hypothetical protein [Myxococcales bacterium]